MALPELGDALQTNYGSAAPAKKKYKLKAKAEEDIVEGEESPQAADAQDKELTKKLLRYLGGKLPS